MQVGQNAHAKEGAAGSAKPDAGPDLDPPYDQDWPGWVLRTRRSRWTILPVLELCALLLCLVAAFGLSRPDLFTASKHPAKASETPRQDD